LAERQHWRLPGPGRTFWFTMAILRKKLRPSSPQSERKVDEQAQSRRISELPTVLRCWQKKVRSVVGDRLDIVVLNAGVSKSARIADHTVEDFDNLFSTNVRGPFFLVQQLLPALGEGSNIVVISSLGARMVVGKPGLENPSILAYAATKGALETLVKNWAAILGPRGIRVNAVAPGVIDTDMSNFTKTEAGREAALGMQALQRIGKPEDIADVVAFLASDGARWITGASIPVDGGSKL
jgi:3-oxoacyl-[acyl-carrier protein] reductase